MPYPCIYLKYKQTRIRKYNTLYIYIKPLADPMDVENLLTITYLLSFHFAVAGIALVAFAIVLNLTVPVGTVNGLIFYANTIKIYEPVFSPHAWSGTFSYSVYLLA